ncbi:MAG: hypothetical protein WAO52_18975 [Prolixibacteraceae bacterium]
MANFEVIKLQIDSTKTDFESVKKYISDRYPRFLDYSNFHCNKAGIPDLAPDLLNEIILNVLEKDPEFLDKLHSKKKGNYTELDFYMLNLIKMNAHSPLAPFRCKYLNGKINTDVNWQRLKIAEEEPVNEVDKPKLILKQFRYVVWVFRGLDLDVLERAVFEHRFMNDEPISDWPGLENKRIIYRIYNQVIEVIHQILYFYDLTTIKPQHELTNRQHELVEKFRKTHQIQLKTNRV